MQQLQPDQAHFVLHTVFLPGLKNEHRITKSVMGAMPADKGDYRPDSCARSASDLAWHIASSEVLFMSAVIKGEFAFGGGARPESITSPADIAKWYEENYQQRFDELTKLSGDQLSKVVDFRGVFQLPAVMYLDFLLHHSIHHRGQLSTYLRPMGGKVPAIYGESYDSAESRKASQQNA